jgi:hypothetical protein
MINNAFYDGTTICDCGIVTPGPCVTVNPITFHGFTFNVTVNDLNGALNTYSLGYTYGDNISGSIFSDAYVPTHVSADGPERWDGVTNNTTPFPPFCAPAPCAYTVYPVCFKPRAKRIWPGVPLRQLRQKPDHPSHCGHLIHQLRIFLPHNRVRRHVERGQGAHQGRRAKPVGGQTARRSRHAEVRPVSSTTVGSRRATWAIQNLQTNKKL